MSLPTSIQEVVDQKLSDRNFEVFVRAIDRSKKSCPNCRYPENAVVYNLMVDQHRREIVEQWGRYRAWRHDQMMAYEERFGEIDHYDTHFEDWLRNQHQRWHLSNLSVVVDLREYRLTSVSAALREIAPCRDCINKYNPNRKKRLPSRAEAQLLESVRQFL